jgi:hypothetical protein
MVREGRSASICPPVFISIVNAGRVAEINPTLAAVPDIVRAGRASSMVP